MIYKISLLYLYLYRNDLTCWDIKSSINLAERALTKLFLNLIVLIYFLGVDDIDQKRGEDLCGRISDILQELCHILLNIKTYIA